MKLLAIDTTEDACSAALLIDTEVTERFELAPRRHSEILLPMMDGLLAEGGIEPVWTRVEALGRAVRAAVRAMGLTVFAASPCDALTAITVPEGVDAAELLRTLGNPGAVAGTETP